MRLTRRAVLLSLLGLSGLAGGGLAWFNRRRREGDLESFVADLIRRRFSHLEIDETDLGVFARDHLRHCFPWELAEVRHYAEAPRSFWSQRFRSWRDDGSELSLARRLFERRLASRFLLATDYFQQDAKLPRAVRYMAYPDPWELGCANPLANLE